jgi:hypothetical protein
MGNWHRWVSRALGLFCEPLSADAGGIYSDFGPGNTFLIDSAWETKFAYMATPFVTTGAGNLETIVTPLFSLQFPLNVGLYTNTGGEPGSLLESWSQPVPGIPAQLATFTSVLNPFLSLATEYWFVITTIPSINGPSNPNDPAWYQNNQGVAGGIFLGASPASLLSFLADSPAPAIELTTGAAVPEPSVWLLVCAGFFALGCMHAGWKRKTASRGFGSE